MNLQLQPRRRRRTAGRVLVFTDAKELMEFKKTSRLIRTVRQLLKKYSADKINCMVTDKKRFTVAAPKNTHNSGAAGTRKELYFLRYLTRQDHIF